MVTATSFEACPTVTVTFAAPFPLASNRPRSSTATTLGSLLAYWALCVRSAACFSAVPSATSNWAWAKLPFKATSVGVTTNCLASSAFTTARLAIQQRAAAGSTRQGERLIGTSSTKRTQAGPPRQVARGGMLQAGCPSLCPTRASLPTEPIRRGTDFPDQFEILGGAVQQIETVRIFPHGPRELLDLLDNSGRQWSNNSVRPTRKIPALREGAVRFVGPPVQLSPPRPAYCVLAP